LYVKGRRYSPLLKIGMQGGGAVLLSSLVLSMLLREEEEKIRGKAAIAIGRR
jgi:hypothetical protein